MNIITDRLPDEIAGSPIYTDYRRWVLYDLMMRDNDLSKDEKIDEMFRLLVKPPCAISNPVDFISGVLDFYACADGQNKQVRKGKTSTGGKSVRVFDFEIDANLILSAFMQAYKIDLADAETSLHWFKFLALLRGLPSGTRMAEVMEIRGVDTSKMKGEQKKRYQKLQAIYALDNDSREPASDEEFKAELDKRFEEMNQHKKL